VPLKAAAGRYAPGVHLRDGRVPDDAFRTRGRHAGAAGRKHTVLKERVACAVVSVAFACETKLLHTVGNVQNVRVEAGGQQYHGPAQRAYSVFCAMCSASAADIPLGGRRAVELGGARALDVAFQDYRIVLLRCVGLSKKGRRFSRTRRAAPEQHRAAERLRRQRAARGERRPDTVAVQRLEEAGRGKEAAS
jgi:hypothetical protein